MRMQAKARAKFGSGEVISAVLMGDITDYKRPISNFHGCTGLHLSFGPLIPDCAARLHMLRMVR